MPHSAYTCSTTLVHQEAVEKAAAHMPDSGKLEKTASYFRLLGDPTRVRILWALHTCELCVCDLCAVLDMEKSAVSHQLSLLRRGGLVKCRREGKSVCYSLLDDHVRLMLENGLSHVHEL